LKSLEKKLSDIDAKELSMWESQLDSGNRMPPHVFQTLTAKLQKEREEIETAIVKTKAAISTPEVRERDRATFIKALDALYDDSISVADKNNLLKACVKKITYHRGATEKLKGKGVGRQWIIQPIDLDIKLKA
jgi:hypothetical protein